MTKKGKAYARAGVDVDLGNKLKRGIQSLVRQTHGPQVLGKIGGFGGLFHASFPGMREPVLVASVDGVGTKLKIAFAMDKHDTVGVDLVNHCINDIAVLGARPLFFLDYIGCERLEPRVFQQLLRGLSRACRGAGCALLGGETAQMPGMYRKGEYDLAGCIVGVVDRAKIIDGSKIKPGDVVLGLRFKWSAHQWLLAGAKNFVRENAAQTEFASTRVDNHGRRRIAARAQKLSAGAGKSSRWRNQRARSYHRWWSHRQFASNFAVEL